MMIPRLALALLIALSALDGGMGAIAAEKPASRYFIAGPVEAELVSVIDGDTLMVNARPWPQQTIAVLVRIRGIDTPEIRAKCARSRALARDARAILADALSRSGGRLHLSSISGDKYFGRVVADVMLDDDRDAASILLASGLARPYDGGHKARESCN